MRPHRVKKTDRISRLLEELVLVAAYRSPTDRLPWHVQRIPLTRHSGSPASGLTELRPKGEAVKVIAVSA